MKYSWDPAKAAANSRKHGVAFPEAATVFRDPLAMSYPDPDHSIGEERFITIGLSSRGRVLFVAHADVDDRIRIISARKATRREAMRTAKPKSDDLRPEYDLTALKGGVRGKYFKRATSASNIVVLAPDVAKAFPTDESVNEALRAVLVASAQVRRPRKVRG